MGDGVVSDDDDMREEGDGVRVLLLLSWMPEAGVLFILFKEELTAAGDEKAGCLS